MTILVLNLSLKDSCKILYIHPDFLTSPPPSMQNVLKQNLPGWDLEFCIKNTKPVSGDSDGLVHKLPLGNTALKDVCMMDGR